MRLVNGIEYGRISRATCRRLGVGFLCLGMAVNFAPVLAEGGLPQGEPVSIGAMPVAAGDAPATPDTSAEPSSSPATPAIFAAVNGKPITVQEFRALYDKLVSERFYHGSVPEGQEETLLNDVKEKLVERMLLIEDAEKRGIKPDTARIEKILADMEARYATKPEWPQNRERVLSGVRELLTRNSLLKQIEQVVRDVPQPTPAEVRAFYGQKPELFTEPEKQRLSVILLKVDPSSPNQVWADAEDEAGSIYRSIEGGADFAEMARLYSDDKSAENGGDIGYLHVGRLPGNLQKSINSLQVGTISQPIKGLEGFWLLRLDERVPPKLHEFPGVEQRAQALLYRDRQDQAWKENIGRLRSTARIEVLNPVSVVSKPK